MKKILTGLKPSGELTLGNYIGSIKAYKKLEETYESYLFIADMHAITINQDPCKLHKNIKDFITLYLACGVDPKKNTIFIQSENIYHTNVSWLLECNSYYGELSRMIQFKEKSKEHSNFTVGLLTYPVLMASDILIYDVDYIPVGIDQKQHVELARDIAIRFNNKYGQTFKVPEPLITKVGTKIMDLQNPTKKMSKSADSPKGVITLLEDEASIRKKIMAAVTDSEGKVYYDLENKPGIANLLTIYASLTNISINEATDKFKEYNYKDFKEEVANIVVKELTSIQNRYHQLLDSKEVEEVLNNGRDKTNQIALEKYNIMKEKIGLGR